MKKFLSVLLAVVMLIGLIPSAVFAEETAKTYTITFRTWNANGQQADGRFSLTATCGEDLKIPMKEGKKGFLRAGYTFTWNAFRNGESEFDFADGDTIPANEVTRLLEERYNDKDGVVYLNQVWHPNTNTLYKVKHVLMDSTGTKVNKAYGTYPAKGTTDELTNAKPIDITGYIPMEFEQVKISGKGNTVVTIQYKRCIDHSNYEVLETVAPTCTVPGSENQKCTLCGTITTVEIPATGHKEVDVPGKAATCTEKGLTDGKWCEVCQMFTVNQKDIPATGHKEVDVPGKAATCTEKGLTDGKWCEVCQMFTVNQKDIPATGHKEVDVPGKAATCTEKGLTDGKWCEVCQMFTVNQKDIPATGHKEVDVPGKAATCTEKGLTDGKWCEVCQMFTVNQRDIPATGHKETRTETLEANCSKEGYVKVICKACDAVVSEETLPTNDNHAFYNGACLLCGKSEACEHTGTTHTDTFEANCSKEGYVKVICDDCGAVVSEETLPTNDNHAFYNGACLLCGKSEACEHTGTTHTDTFEANCSKEGYVKVICDDCDAVVSEETLPTNDNHAFYNGACLLCGESEACEHNYVVVKREDATCTFPAYVWYECSECGEEMNREEGEADGEHNYVVVKREDATCTLPAYVWYECSECGEQMNREEGEADGEHKYVVVKREDATCTLPAYVWYECSECGEQMNREEGEADGEHKYVVVKREDATCTLPAYVWYECSECGNEMNREEGEADGEHKKVATKQTIVEATCTEDGYIREVKTCMDCGEEVSSTDYPLGAAVGHKWENGVCSVCGENSPFGPAPKCEHEKVATKQTIVEATCTEDGYIHDVRSCVDCGEVVSSTDYPLGAATGHKWEDGVCSVCGENSPFEVAPKCEHEKVATKQTIVEATCTEDGYILDVKTCMNCGEEVSSKTYPLAAATGHKWEDGVCSVCGEESPFEVAPKCEHDRVATKQTIVKATCTEDGYIRDVKTCMDCGEEVSSTDYPLGAAVGHKWENGVCSVCGENSPFGPAPKCEHEKVATKQTIVEATCTEDGYIHDVRTCVDCGEVVSSTDYPLAAAGHNYGDGVCTVCGAEEPVAEEPAPEKAKASIMMPRLFKVTVKVEEGGKVQVKGANIMKNPTIMVAFGASRILNIIPDEGYVVEDILVNGKSVGALDKYVLKAANKNYTIEVKFAESVEEIAG